MTADKGPGRGVGDSIWDFRILDLSQVSAFMRRISSMQGVRHTLSPQALWPRTKNAKMWLRGLQDNPPMTPPEFLGHSVRLRYRRGTSQGANPGATTFPVDGRWWQGRGVQTARGCGSCSGPKLNAWDRLPDTSPSCPSAGNGGIGNVPRRAAVPAHASPPSGYAATQCSRQESPRARCLAPRWNVSAGLP
jgi:hypothetical protein